MICVRYHACKANDDTDIVLGPGDRVVVNGEEFLFATDHVVWLDCIKETHGRIIAAVRDDCGTLKVDIIRHYSKCRDFGDEYMEVET